MKRLLIIAAAFILLNLPLSLHADDDEAVFSDSRQTRFDSSPALDSLIRGYGDRISPDSIRSYIEQLVAFKTRFMLVDNRREIAFWIGEKFRSFGYDGIVIDSFRNTIEFPRKSREQQTSWQYNVSAGLTGTDKPSEVYVLGAHYDCFIMGPDTDPYVYAPGANNNASGVAVCLELARILKQNRFAPASTIDFVAFGSEEFMTMFLDGNSGSVNYIEKQKQAGRTIKAMLDNNQVSYVPDTARWKLDFQHYPGADSLTDLAHYICENYTRIVPVDTNDHIMYSDARYFHEAGVPAIFFEEFYFNPNNFTKQDIPENCNVAYCAEVARISCGMLVYLNQ